MKKVLKVIKGSIKYILVLILALVIFVGITLSFGYVLIRPTLDRIDLEVFNRLSSITDNTFKLDTDTTVYSAENKVICEINANNYIYTPISDVSEDLIQGYIAVEDNDFLSHNGISLKGIIRAGLSLIKNKGEITQGGSTITQQVLKNNVFADIDNKFERKILEIFLAPEFEKQFSKSQIMEFYLNTNYYQNGCYGVGSASNYYFGKSPKDLSLSECAILIGLSNNPSRYNPVKHPQASRDKRDFVLGRMLQEGVITQEEYNKAIQDNPLVDGQYQLALNKEYRTFENYQTSYAVYGTALKLMELDGFKFKYSFNNEDEYSAYTTNYNNTLHNYLEEVRNGGYQIYTSFSSERQAMLQSIVDDTLNKQSKEVVKGKFALQGSATLVNNSTGLVEAIVGGRGEIDEFNRGFLSYRQPGSAIKPLVVYAPAFETGNYFPSLIVKDYKGKNFPQNANRSYLGDMTIREAVARSTNTIPFEILQKIGVRNGVEYLSKMHFNKLTVQDFNNYSMALGGFTYGTNTTEMAKAYSTLASGGVYTNNTCILKIVKDGEVLYEYSNSQLKDKTQVYSEDVAYLMIDTLKGVNELPYGTGKLAKIDNVYSVGKTGTTNSNKDAWYCGVTPDYSLSVWVGYDTPKSINNGGSLAMNIYKKMIEFLYQGKQCKDFKKPLSIRELPIDSKGYPIENQSPSHKKDIFSGTIIDNKINSLVEKKEEEQLFNLQQAQEEEKAKVQNLTSVINNLTNNFKITSVESYTEYLNKYSHLTDEISQLIDINSQETLQGLLDTDYKNRLTDESVLKFKVEYEMIEEENRKLQSKLEDDRKKQEELNSNLQEEINKNKDLLLEQLEVNMELSLSRLLNVIVDTTSTPEKCIETYNLAVSTLDELQGKSSSYGDYLQRLSDLEGKLEKKLIDIGFIESTVEQAQDGIFEEGNNNNDDFINTKEEYVNGDTIN